MFNWKLLNTIYLYDGTLNGLFTIAFDCYISKTIPINIISETLYEFNLLDKTYYIKTDEQKAQRIWNGIYKNISYSALFNCYYAFLSCRKNKELAILKFILNGFISGPQIITMQSIDYVNDVLTLKRNVWFEAHRLKGLTRLQELTSNLYYASIHPDNNVIEIVGKFLKDRFPTQNIILHDKNRNIAFFYKQPNYAILDVPENIPSPTISNSETQFQTLWKTYFNTISIKERQNSRLQMQYMPKKYWKDLIELN